MQSHVISYRILQAQHIYARQQSRYFEKERKKRRKTREKRKDKRKKKKDKKIIRSNIEGNECPEKYYEQRAREDQRGEDKNKQKTFEPEAR